MKIEFASVSGYLGTLRRQILIFFSALLCIVTALQMARAQTVNCGNQHAYYEAGVEGTHFWMTRFGITQNIYAEGGFPQPAMAMEVFLDPKLVTETYNGFGILHGPMRSYMFVNDSPADLRYAIEWHDNNDSPPDGFYLREDDGSTVLYIFSFVRCEDAPIPKEKLARIQRERDAMKPAME